MNLQAGPREQLLVANVTLEVLGLLVLDKHLGCVGRGRGRRWCGEGSGVEERGVWSGMEWGRGWRGVEVATERQAGDLTAGLVPLG